MHGRYSYSGRYRRQRGVVLFVALIAVLIMTLAGVAIMRTLDSSSTLGGNLAYRQAALSQADRGVNAAFSWLMEEDAADLWNDQTGVGYLSSRTLINDWTQAASWPAGQVVTLPAMNGYTVDYQIFRLCTVAGDASQPNNPGAVNAPGQSCNTVAPGAGAGGGDLGNSHGSDSPQFAGNLLLHYQIVVRVSGPRNTRSYVQVIASRGAN